MTDSQFLVVLGLLKKNNCISKYIVTWLIYIFLLSPAYFLLNLVIKYSLRCLRYKIEICEHFQRCKVLCLKQSVQAIHKILLNELNQTFYIITVRIFFSEVFWSRRYIEHIWRNFCYRKYNKLHLNDQTGILSEGYLMTKNCITVRIRQLRKLNNNALTISLLTSQITSQYVI